MVKRTLTVFHEGQKFTRHTARIYTHVVLIKHGYDFTRTLRMTEAADNARLNYDYYVREANPDTRKYEHDPVVMARFEAMALMTEDELAKHAADEAAAGVEKELANGHFNNFYVMTWRGSPDLAQKEAARLAKYSYAEVVVVPLPPLTEKES